MIRVTFNSSIYLWVSINYGFIYIGQTNNNLGIIARAYQHINEGGTLFNRVWERVGVNLYDVDDLGLFNFPLPNERKYQSNESIYRLAVEYLIQRYILEQKHNFRSSLKVISNVKSNDLVENIEVKEIANNIVLEAASIVNSL